MQPLIKAIILIIEKYVRKDEKKINGYIDADSITLQFMKNKKIYKKLKIEQIEQKLKVTFMDENITKMVDIDGLDNIIEILEKQCNDKILSQADIEELKNKYTKGTKIILHKMYDLQTPEPKITGLVDFVDDAGNIHMRWSNGSTLSLIEGVDEFTICDGTNDKKQQPVIRVMPVLSELKHKEIVDKLLSQAKSVGEAMNLVQDIVVELKNYDQVGVQRFFDKCQEEFDEAEGQDYSIVNGILVDWKELNKPEVLGEFVELALNSMSNNTSREKLREILLNYRRQ